MTHINADAQRRGQDATMTLTRPMLCGRSILIAHGDEFQAGYLSHVVRTATGRAPRVAMSQAEALWMLVADPVPDAVALHSHLLGNDLPELMEQAKELGVPVVVLDPSSDEVSGRDGCRSLRTPYAAFQVVELLAAVITEGDVELGGAQDSPNGQGLATSFTPIV